MNRYHTNSTRINIPVESFDSKYIAFQYVSAMDIHGWLVLSSHLNLDYLTRAIEAVCIEFPILKAHVVERWCKPYFEILPNYPTLYHSVIKWDDIYEVPKEYLRVFNEKFDVSRGPLIQFYYFESKTLKHSFFGLKMNHSIGDGIAGLRIIDLVAENYTKIKNKQIIKRPINRTDRSLKLIYQRFRRNLTQNLRINFLKAWIKFFLLERRPDQLNNCPYSTQITITPFYILQPDTNKIKALARQNNATINAVLTAAIVWAFFRWNGEFKKFRVLIPQDLRRYAKNMTGVHLDNGYWLPVGNMVGIFYIDVFRKDFKSNDELLAVVQRKLTTALQTHQGLANVMLLAQNVTKLPIPLFKYIFSKIGVKRLGKMIFSSTLLTNGGAIPPGRLIFGDSTPILFSTALPSIPGLPVIVSSTGTKDTISVVLTHNKIGFDQKRFIGYLKEFLLD